MFSDLPTDLIDRILTILPDFQSLSSAIRTSNSVIYSVFQSHPKSIVRSVAHNVAGPAFPQALRFLHFSSLVDTTGSSSDALDKLPDEYHILETPITRTLAHQLEEHARMIFSLENLFSLRFKDRTSSLSRLTDSESVCFHRAMYRFWICAMLEQQTVDGSDTGCFQFLEPYSSSELFEIKRIMLFLKDVVGFVGISSNSWILPEDQDCCIFAGPDMIWEAFEDRDLDGLRASMEIDSDDFESITLSALDRLWARRKVQKDKVVENAMKMIVDVATGSSDICDKCLASRQESLLWGTTTWPLFDGYHQPMSISRLLDGLLPQNNYETTFLLHNQFFQRGPSGKPSFSWATMFEEMFNLVPDTSDVWSAHKWYCDTCILEFVRLRLRQWALKRRAELGQLSPDNCWYGYNCRTQTHRYTHAQKLNHLCIPTRGDSPPPMNLNLHPQVPFPGPVVPLPHFPIVYHPPILPVLAPQAAVAVAPPNPGNVVNPTVGPDGDHTDGSGQSNSGSETEDEDN